MTGARTGGWYHGVVPLCADCGRSPYMEPLSSSVLEPGDYCWGCLDDHHRVREWDGSKWVLLWERDEPGRVP